MEYLWDFYGISLGCSWIFVGYLIDIYENGISNI